MMQRSYLVEVYWPGIDRSTFRAAVARLTAAARRISTGEKNVAIVGAYLIPADESVLCFLIGSEEDARAVGAAACMPFDRLMEAFSSTP
jgi:hypothetical protein